MAEPVDEVPESPAGDEETRNDDAEPLTELLVELGRKVSVLVFLEGQLATARNLPEVRRAARDIAGALVAALAFLTAFAFANVAALDGLTAAVSTWLAALILCIAWLALGSALVLALMVRAGRVSGWRWWRVFRAGPEESLADLEQARAEAEQSVLETLARLAPAITVEIASASISVAGDAAGDLVEEAGEDMLETSEEIVDAIAKDLPGGSVVSQVWNVVLIPGRTGLRVATTVLRRGDPKT